ncbi:hypothetical protein F5X96DRAFT_365411 [Biscogniauxia mediterranea]|nr:hypothetical protein F5X96DRAFT_365411 [Biscogniauxia mediterranea]
MFLVLFILPACYCCHVPACRREKIEEPKEDNRKGEGGGVSPLALLPEKTLHVYIHVLDLLVGPIDRNLRSGVHLHSAGEGASCVFFFQPVDFGLLEECSHAAHKWQAKSRKESSVETDSLLT